MKKNRKLMTGLLCLFLPTVTVADNLDPIPGAKVGDSGIQITAVEKLGENSILQIVTGINEGAVSTQVDYVDGEIKVDTELVIQGSAIGNSANSQVYDLEKCSTATLGYQFNADSAEVSAVGNFAVSPSQSETRNIMAIGNSIRHKYSTTDTDKEE